MTRSISFISVANYTETFKNYRVNSWSSVCPHGRSYFISFSRISSALMPLASSFFSTLSASAFFASRDASSFSAFFKADFFSFKSAFKVSMLAVMDAISAVSVSFADCFSAIYVAKSAVTVFGLFLLPLVLGIGHKPFSKIIIV